MYEEEDFTTGVLTEAESLRIDYRQTFEESLLREGLQLEKVGREVRFYFSEILVWDNNK